MYPNIAITEATHDRITLVETFKDRKELVEIECDDKHVMTCLKHKTRDCYHIMYCQNCEVSLIAAAKDYDIVTGTEKSKDRKKHEMDRFSDRARTLLLYVC